MHDAAPVSLRETPPPHHPLNSPAGLPQEVRRGGLQESRLLPEPLKHIKGSRLDREGKQEFRTNIREFVGWLGAGLEPAASWGVGESDQGSKAQRSDDGDSCRSARRPPHFRIRPAGTGRGGTKEAVKHV